MSWLLGFFRRWVTITDLQRWIKPWDTRFKSTSTSHHQSLVSHRFHTDRWAVDVSTQIMTNLVLCLSRMRPSTTQHYSAATGFPKLPKLTSISEPWRKGGPEACWPSIFCWGLAQNSARESRDPHCSEILGGWWGTSRYPAGTWFGTGCHTQTREAKGGGDYPGNKLTTTTTITTTTTTTESHFGKHCLH